MRGGALGLGGVDCEADAGYSNRLVSTQETARCGDYSRLVTAAGNSNLVNWQGERRRRTHRVHEVHVLPDDSLEERFLNTCHEADLRDGRAPVRGLQRQEPDAESGIWLLDCRLAERSIASGMAAPDAAALGGGREDRHDCEAHECTREAEGLVPGGWKRWRLRQDGEWRRRRERVSRQVPRRERDGLALRQRDVRRYVACISRGDGSYMRDRQVGRNRRH